VSIDQFLIVNFSDFLSGFKYAEPLNSAFKFMGFFMNASAILNPGGASKPEDEQSCGEVRPLQVVTSIAAA